MIFAQIAASLLTSLVAACQEQPGVQFDFSGLGQGALAERVSAGYLVGDDEYRSRDFNRWLTRQCQITNLESARDCAIGIGMACDTPADGALSCQYRGIARGRDIWFTIRPSWHDREGPWMVVQVDVALHYVEGHGATMTYRKSVIE